MTRFETITLAIFDLLEAFIVCMFIAAVLVWAGVATGAL